jgi:hypothetical protein
MFQNALPSGKNMYIFPLHWVFGVYLVKILLLPVGQGSSPLLLIGWVCKFFDEHI